MPSMSVSQYVKRESKGERSGRWEKSRMGQAEFSSNSARESSGMFFAPIPETTASLMTVAVLHDGGMPTSTTDVV